MSGNSILITAPSLDTKHNVSGISSITSFIISNNSNTAYTHFELGRKDDEKRNLVWVFRMINTTIRWMFIVASKKTTLIHFNFALSKASILRDAPLVLFAKLIRKKIIIHIHGGDYLANKKAPGWMKFILKRVFSKRSPVIVLSTVEQQIISEQYKTSNVHVLPNCVDLNEAKAFHRVYNTAAMPNLLFIGRISTSKGIEYIYQALKELKSKQVAFKFYMAGAGPDENEYVEKFSQLLGSGFEFKGVVSGLTKTNLFKSCDVFLLPSLFEGLPMSLLEAMSFGLVPVVTPVGSMKHVIKTGYNGVLLNENPAVEIAAAIEGFAATKESIKTLSGNAADYIFKNYDPAKYIISLQKVYDAA